MIVEVSVVARDRLAGIEVFGLQPFAVCREGELRARLRCRGAFFERDKRICYRARFAHLDVDIAGLKDAAQIGFVRSAGAQPLDRRRLIPERLQEGIGKLLSVKGLLGKVRYGFFNLNGVHSAFSHHF